MTNKEQSEREEVVGRIVAHQQREGMTERKLLLTYPGLGTSKDWWAMRNGKLEDRDAGALLTNYRAVLAQIEAMAAQGEVGEDLYDDLHPVCELLRVAPRLLTTPGIDRVAIIQGEPGSGKSTAAAILAERYRSAIVRIEATDAWGAMPRAMLHDLLGALGMETPPTATSDRFIEAVGRMAATRRVLVIDEAHHLGPKSLNVVKSLVNQTRWGFVLMGIGSLWRKLERESYEEARQLTTNRLAERVKLDCPCLRDVVRMVERRCKLTGKDAERAAVMIAKYAAPNGGLLFVAAVCRRLTAAAGRDGTAPTLQEVGVAIEKELKAR